MSLPKRIITTLMIKNGVLYRSKKFKPDYRYTLNFVDMHSVDEIVLLDISENNLFNQTEKKLFVNELLNLAKNAFVPFSVGGGIRTLDDIYFLLKNGADRVILNSIALENPKFIDKASKEFGSQCIIVCVDVLNEENNYFVMSNNGKIKSKKNLSGWIDEIHQLNAGEIFLQSVNKDGALTGYDLELVKKINKNVKLPLIVSSGAGKWEHVEKIFEIECVSAASLTNIFHFTEKSIYSLKSFLKDKFYIRK